MLLEETGILPQLRKGIFPCPCQSPGNPQFVLRDGGAIQADKKRERRGESGASGKRLPTLTIDTQIGFRSAADRAAFADDLTAAVLDLAGRYHHDDGRPHRLVVAAHPLPEESA